LRRSTRLGEQKCVEEPAENILKACFKHSEFGMYRCDFGTCYHGHGTG
jgi:hypothetical protein